PAAALIEQHDAIRRGIEELAALRIAARPRSTVQEHHRLAARIAALFVIERVQRRHRQGAGLVGVDGGIERAAGLRVHSPSVNARTPKRNAWDFIVISEPRPGSKTFLGQAARGITELFAMDGSQPHTAATPQGAGFRLSPE